MYVCNCTGTGYGGDNCEIENTCTSYSFADGITGENLTDGCYDNIILTSIIDNNCQVQCKNGYSGSDIPVTISCGLDGGTPNGEIICTTFAPTAVRRLQSRDCTKHITNNMSEHLPS
eukprot:UN03598